MRGEGAVTLANPIGKGDLGCCEIGRYVIEGKFLTLTVRDGLPLLGNRGEFIAHRLIRADDEKGVAKRLTLEHRRSVRGDHVMAGFGSAGADRSGTATGNGWGPTVADWHGRARQAGRRLSLGP